ncbi:MAG: hypothetical protein LCH30_10310, partial [Proteobacteria bacterium]|nr:hypothetical protein [Pseudomonadota bacterium]
MILPEDLLRLTLTGNLGNVGKISVDVLFSNPQFAEFQQELLNLGRKTPRILTWLDKEKLQEAMRGQSFFYQLQGMDFLNQKPIIEQAEFQNYLNRCIAQMKASNNFKKLKAILLVWGREQKDEVYKYIKEKINNEKISNRKAALEALALTGYKLGRSRLLMLYPFIKKDDFINPEIAVDISNVLKIYVDILGGKDFDNLFVFIKDNLFNKAWNSYLVSLVLKHLATRLAKDSTKIEALFSFLVQNLSDENRVEFALDALIYLINLLDEQQLESISPQIRKNLVSNDVNKFDNAQKVLIALKQNKIKQEKIKLLLLDIHQGLLNRRIQQKNDRDILSIIAAMQAVPIKEWFREQLKDSDVLERLKAWRIAGAYSPPLSQLELNMLVDVLINTLSHPSENARILAIEVANLFAYALVSEMETLLPSLQANLRKNMLISNTFFYEKLHLLITKTFINFAGQINKIGNGFAWLETNLDANDKESLEIKLKGFYSLIKSNATNVPVDSILLVLQENLEILKQAPKDKIKDLLPIMLELLVSLLKDDLLNSERLEKLKSFLPLLEDILLTLNFDRNAFKALGILSEFFSGWIASKATKRIIAILEDQEVGNKFKIL